MFYRVYGTCEVIKCMTLFKLNRNYSVCKGFISRLYDNSIIGVRVRSEDVYSGTYMVQLQVCA